MSTQEKTIPMTEKISGLVKSTIQRYDKLKMKDKERFYNILKEVPMTAEQIKTLIELNDPDFPDLAAEKRLERYEDTETAMFDAVEMGDVKTIEDFCEWLGIPQDSTPEEIIYQCNMYMRLGERGRPETVIAT